jgi:hypothetical protein
VAANGDVNSDGAADVLVGAERADHSLVTAGQTGGAYLFSGPMSSGTHVATEARVRLDGSTRDEVAGGSVGLVPDVSGDGRAEVLVGARFGSSTGIDVGVVSLVTSERL